MEDDLVELARICLAHARITQAPRAAAALRRMAKEYQRRAALLRGDNGPRLRVNASGTRCRTPISGRSGILAGRPRTVARHHAQS
jgi:pyruvate kinase